MKATITLGLICLLSVVHKTNAFTLHSSRSVTVHERRRNGSALHVLHSAGISAPGIDASQDVPISWKSPTGKKNELPREVMAGLVVALATIPTSISYSTVVGINPITGIWNSALVGLVMTIVGGAPGLIAGSAGVIALPMAKLVASAGLPYMSAAAMLSAAMQLLFGGLKLSSVLNVVTEPVICGFLNALGIFLLQTQIKIFKASSGAWLAQTAMVPSLLTAALCFTITRAMPKIKKDSVVPPSLVGLLTASAVAHSLQWTRHIKTLADKVGPALFAGGLSALPKFTGVPNVPLNSATLKVIGSASAGMAVICIVETLLAMRIATDMFRSKAARYERNDNDRAVLGNGLGTLVASLFGGFGGCGLIPNTLLNGSSGGVGYASGFAYAAFSALAVVACAPLLGKMPMAALAGLMFSVAGNTLQWKESAELVLHAPRGLQQTMDLLAMLATTALCFKVDMGLGVAVGVVLAQLPSVLRRLTGRAPPAPTVSATVKMH